MSTIGLLSSQRRNTGKINPGVGTENEGRRQLQLCLEATQDCVLITQGGGGPSFVCPGHNQLTRHEERERLGKNLITQHTLGCRINTRMFLWSKLLNEVIKNREARRDVHYPLACWWQWESHGRKWGRDPCCCSCLISKSSLRLVRNRTKLMKIFPTVENKWKYCVASWLDSI